MMKKQKVRIPPVMKTERTYTMETISEELRNRTEKFAALHKGPGMFILPNAWDIGSAVVYQNEGFKAVATSSAGVAYSLGQSDCQQIDFEDLLWVVRKMTSRVNIPVSVDFERGYADTAAEIKENARRLLLAGASGFNVEDGDPKGAMGPVERQLMVIDVLKELKKELSLNFVINARTDAYWYNVADEDRKLSLSLERGRKYAEAGADCVFAAGPVDLPAVKRIVEEIPAPINILLNGKYHDFKELEKAGVRRLSIGSGPSRCIYEDLIHMADDLKEGKCDSILDCKFTYGQANEYFKK